MSLELSTNVSLRDDDNQRFQFLYATQLYGTLYGVYGKFTSTADGNKRIINRIDFIGINYKGEANLRLCLDSKNPDMIRQKEPPTTSGSSPNKEIKMDLWVERDISDPVDILRKPYLDLDQISGQDYSVENGDYFRIERKLERMNPITTPKMRDRAFVKGHFDSEFYVRDGLLIKPKADHPGSIDYSASSGGEVSVNDEFSSRNNKFNILISSINCTPSVIKLIF